MPEKRGPPPAKFCSLLTFFILPSLDAYSLAAADLELPHEVVDSMMITDGTSFGEGWDLIDAIPTNEIFYR